MKTLNTYLPLTLMFIALLTVTSCGKQKFHIAGNITEAKDSTLYLEHIGLDGTAKIDSVKLGEDGAFDFAQDGVEAPEFYRLRIANQSINLSIDSTETVTVNAAYPSMMMRYEVKGSRDCEKIKELSMMQMDLQIHINQIAANPNISIDSANVLIDRVLKEYKNTVKTQYIFKEPMKAYAYYALFQTVQMGRMNTLIFNPRNRKDDVQVFAAVATSWDTYHPDTERGKNLHNIAIEGMKDVRIIEQRKTQTIDPSKVNEGSLIDIALQDNKGQTRRLSDLKGKVVLLDFHLFADEKSTERIMALRDLYNKYHAQGLEIYQVSVDPDEHFWKVSTEALPWISVRDEDGPQARVLALYNVQRIPTYFLINRDNELRKRDAQITDLDTEIKNMLKQ